MVDYATILQKKETAIPVEITQIKEALSEEHESSSSLITELSESNSSEKDASDSEVSADAKNKLKLTKISSEFKIK